MCSVGHRALAVFHCSSFPASLSALRWRDRHEWWHLAQVGSVCWQKKKVEKGNDSTVFSSVGLCQVCTHTPAQRWECEWDWDEQILIVKHLSAADKRAQQATKCQQQRQATGLMLCNTEKNLHRIPWWWWCSSRAWGQFMVVCFDCKSTTLFLVFWTLTHNYSIGSDYLSRKSGWFCIFVL